jgi:excinuclease ABC subunit A
VRRGTVADAVDDRAHASPTAPRAVVTWRVEVDDPERYLGVRERLLEEGYRRVLVDGETRDLDEVPPSEAVPIGGLDVIVDRLVAAAVERARLAEALARRWRGAGARRCTASTAGQP